MKQIILSLGLMLLFTTIVSAQMHKQTDTVSNAYKPLVSADRLKLLEHIDFIANMQYANSTAFENGTYTGSSFAMNQFRLEIKGYVLDSTVFFRFRNRYTRTPTVQSVDKLDSSVDMAFVGFHLSDKLSLAFGKMIADYGGYEFDTNPINIYQYNTIIANADDFLTGAHFAWNAPKNQQFMFQVLNARTKSFSELYDDIPEITEAKFPAAFVGNWRGSFADGLFSTFWSYSYIQETKGKNVQYIALGNQIKLKKTVIQYDFKYMAGQIDRLGVISDLVADDFSSFIAFDTDYIEHWLRVQHSFVPQWNVSLTAMVSDAYWNGNPETISDNHIRTAWGIIPALEYAPFEKLNLKFFIAYVGRKYKYSSDAKANFGLTDSNTGQLLLGFSSPLKFL
ncbi:hypothetical protein ES677_11620 [Bizionia gelidisalsuginis]|uniref:Phosphate-selective porin O and P n=1 Tax=Bizionia gelidisalsuginis TaxID=291188 RepID=A0ABY3M8L3_9FLAO|nr:porin [Bizionia gelidisalsuginis]TYC10583.1 hypothetical protein ES677_11620 [Bizionia gelidisalsuginis]